MTTSIGMSPPRSFSPPSPEIFPYVTNGNTSTTSRITASTPTIMASPLSILPHLAPGLSVAGYVAIYTFSDPDETGTVTKKRRPFRDAAYRGSSGELLTSCHPFHQRAWRPPPP